MKNFDKEMAELAELAELKELLDDFALGESTHYEGREWKGTTDERIKNTFLSKLNEAYDRGKREAIKKLMDSFPKIDGNMSNNTWEREWEKIDAWRYENNLTK